MTGMDIKHPLFVTIVAALVATISLMLTTAPEAANARQVMVEIKAFKYAPRKPALKVGDVVIWTNRDIVPHTVTALDGSWDSGTIKAGGQWQTTITAAMLTDYYCRFHPMMKAAFTIGMSTPK